MGNWVYIKLQLYRQRLVVTKESHILSHKFYSPYQVIERIRTMAYKLCLPYCRNPPSFSCIIIKEACEV